MKYFTFSVLGLFALVALSACTELSENGFRNEARVEGGFNNIPCDVSNGALKSWNTPVLLDTFSITNPHIPFSISSALGDAAVLYEVFTPDSVLVTKTARYVIDSGWSVPSTLSDYVLINPNESLAVDAFGTSYIVTTKKSEPQRLLLLRNQHGSITEELVKEVAANTKFTATRVATSVSGAVSVAWTEDTNFKAATWARVRSAEGAWTEPQELSDERQITALSMLQAVNDPGSVLVTWFSENFETGAASSFLLWARLWKPNEGWGPLLNVSSTIGNNGLRASMDASHNILLVWKTQDGTTPGFGQGGLKYRLFPYSATLAPESGSFISANVNTGVGAFDAYLSQNGNAIISWNQRQSDIATEESIFYKLKENFPSLNQFILAPPCAGTPGQMVARVSNGGYISFVFEKGAGDSNLCSAHKPAGTNTFSFANVENFTGISKFSSASIDCAGNMMVTWHQAESGVVRLFASQLQ